MRKDGFSREISTYDDVSGRVGIPRGTLKIRCSEGLGALGEREGSASAPRTSRRWNRMSIFRGTLMDRIGDAQ